MYATMQHMYVSISGRSIPLANSKIRVSNTVGTRREKIQIQRRNQEGAPLLKLVSGWERGQGGRYAYSWWRRACSPPMYAPMTRAVEARTKVWRNCSAKGEWLEDDIGELGLWLGWLV